MSPRQDFGRTWWGKAWIEALEQRARLDPNRLPRGRTYARHDHVLSLAADPGEVTALVAGSRPTPYRVRLRVREFTDAEWERVIDAITARAGHAAALLDGELLPEVLDDVAAGGVDLLPGPGELGPQCSCPDWADPCKHAAAVCYLVAHLLDRDPFELFHLRGRGRDQLLSEIRARRRTPADPTRGRRSDRAGRVTDLAADRAVAARPTVAAREAFARVPTTLQDLRALDVPVRLTQPGRPPMLPVAPPEGAGPEVAELQALARDAAERAFALATGADDGHDLDEEQDLARRAAALLGTPALAAAADRAGMPARRLVRLARAWQAGGVEGIAVSEGHLGVEEPPPSSAAAAVAALAQAVGDGAAVRVRGSRITAGTVQLRWAPTGRWYRFEKVGGQWRAAGPPSVDPAVVLGGSASAPW